MTVIKGAATELWNGTNPQIARPNTPVPAIIAMTASSLYNMVDSIFIGLGVGPMAISGLALTFPLMNLAAAFGSLVGVGAATLISMRLGQKDYASAQYILGNVVVPNFIIGLGFGLRHPALPRPDPLLLRGERGDDRLRPRLHVDHPDGQRRNAHVPGTELRSCVRRDTRASRCTPRSTP